MPKKKPAQLSKREKFEKSGRFPVKKAVIIGAAAVVVIVGAVVGYTMATRTAQAGGAVVQQGGANYSSGPVQMTVLPKVVNGGNLQFSLAEIKAKKLVAMLYNRTTPMPSGYNQISGNGLPVIAYVAPSGRLVVATSLCEPCRSWEFHIEGTDLVCNTCYTHWDLNTLAGKSGGCQAYPPKELTATVQGDTVSVPTSVLESWQPRI